jgi:4-amino-4-deoxy-L-arabinose transferase-like glycosyltransferase
MRTGTGDGAGRRVLRDAGVILLVCVCVFWLRLGGTGLSMTEGHRVIPAWEMLESGDWSVPRLFGQVYLRKPPGMPWLVAASSWALGQTEFAARAVSALASTCAALLAWLFAGRWFGGRFAAGAGVLFALTPLFWAPGRSAEIEAVNNFGSLATMLLTIDLLILGERSRTGRYVRGAALALAIVVTALAKGPAAGPCLAAAAAGCCLARGSWSSLRSPCFWGGVAAGGLVIGAVAWRVWESARTSGETAIMQSPGEFLWGGPGMSWARLAMVAAMPAVAWASGLPASLALLFPWGADARAEGRIDEQAWTAARAAGFTWVIAVGLYAALGVDNARYAMPAMTLAPVLAPYVLGGMAGGFTAGRERIARVMSLGSPMAWAIVLGAAAAAYVTTIEPSRRMSSGREAGWALAAYLPDGTEVWANDLVEARPETLAYTARRAAEEGRRVRVRWKPSLSEGELPPTGVFAALRTDAGATDLDALERAGHLSRLEPITRGAMHKYTFTLFRVTPGP